PGAGRRFVERVEDGRDAQLIGDSVGLFDGPQTPRLPDELHRLVFVALDERLQPPATERARREPRRRAQGDLLRAECERRLAGGVPCLLRVAGGLQQAECVRWAFERTGRTTAKAIVGSVGDEVPRVGNQLGGGQAATKPLAPPS